MLRDTKLTRAAEERFHRPLVDVLVDLYNRLGFTGMATELGVSRSTIWYWLLRCGIEIKTVALRPGERLEIIKAVPTPRAAVAPARKAQ